MNSNEIDNLLDEYGEIPIQQVVVKKGNDSIILTEEELLKHTSKVLNYILGDIEQDGDFGKRAVALRSLIELKKAWWPATQKNINANVNLIQEKIRIWREENKDLLEDEPETNQFITAT